MSHWNSDADAADYFDGPYVTAVCTDCGGDFVSDQTTRICDPCWDTRERHTSALEIRFMLKALLRSDLTKIREVA